MTVIPNDKRALDYGSAAAILDIQTCKLVDSIEIAWMHDKNIIDEYLVAYKQWIQTTKNNLINGLDEFPYQCYSNGTTEAFDKFYMKNKDKRFRCFRGEYMYHKLAWRDKFDWEWIETESLRKGDAVVISLPFADTGDKHLDWEWLMTQCDLHDIPVLVDCAYFGICKNIVFDFNHRCITDIVFSLSKTFPLAYARCGIRFTREDNDDTMFVYHKIHYNNKLSAGLALQYLINFSPDYIPNKYAHKQIELCKELDVVPSKCVLFGIDYNDRYSEYNRGGQRNRLSFHKRFTKDQHASTE
jgi:hypothetical protein